MKTLLSSDNFSSEHNSAFPSLSSVRWSTWATGMAPIVFAINSISSLSMSLTTKIPFLAKKCNDKSLVASLKIDF